MVVTLAVAQGAKPKRYMMVAETARAADKTPVKTWKDITLIYTTAIKGKIEPCG